MSENEVEVESLKFLRVLSERDSRLKKIIKEKKSSHRIKIDVDEACGEDANFLYEKIIERIFEYFREKTDNRVQKVIDYYEENNKFPSTTDKDSEIKSTAEFLKTQIANFKNGKSFYRKLIEFVRQNSPARLEIVKRVLNSAEKQTHLILTYYNENNKFPAFHDKDPEVKKLANFLSTQLVYFKNGKKFNQELIDIVGERCPERLDKKELDLRPITAKVQLINDYFSKNNKFPSARDKDSDIKKLGTFLDRQLAAFKNGKKYDRELIDLIRKEAPKRLEKVEAKSSAEKSQLVID